MKTLRALTLAAALVLVTAAPALLLTPASADSTPYLKFGMDWGSIKAQREYGAPPDYGMVWVGVWNAGSGWGSVEYALDEMKRQGVTPVIQWYYWGDHISPSCVENGCGGKTKAQWYEMAHKLADTLATKFEGTEVLVNIENEFNKQGIDTPSYAPTFDQYVKEHNDIFHAVPGVKTIAGFGAWNKPGYNLFPKTIAHSDLLGFQMMRGSTRDTEANYRDAANAITSTSQYLFVNFGKPTILYDLALSSYPEPQYLSIQQETLAEIMSRLGEYKAAGLTAIVYRGLGDSPNMDLANYFGQAERHWGFRRADQSEKPALATWVKGVQDERAGAGLPPAPLPAIVRTEASLPVTSVVQGGKLTGTLTVKNSGGQAITMKSLAFAARPPGGSNAYGPYKDFGSVANVLLNPGETKTFTFTRAFTTSDPTGQWRVYAAVQFPDGRWEDQGPTTYFSVEPKPATFSGSIGISPMAPYRGQTGTFTVKLSNSGSVPGTLSGVSVYAQPTGADPVLLAGYENVTLAAGETRSWTVTREFTASDAIGEWTAYVAWHQDGARAESPVATFRLDDMPARPEATVGLNATLVTQGDSLTGALVLTNTGGKEITLRKVVFAARPPGGTRAGGPYLDFGSIDSVTIAPGETKTLQYNKRFTAKDPVGEWMSYPAVQMPDGSWRDIGPAITFSVKAAPEPWSWRQEAEAFQAKSTGGRYGDATASASAGWNLWSNGYVQNSFSVPAAGTYRLVVDAKGSVAGNVWPAMAIQVDGKTVWSGSVVSTQHWPYGPTLTLAGGSHNVRVLFTNDAMVNGQDRNLYVDRVSVIQA